MKCHRCGNICNDKFMETKRMNKAGTEIELLNRICYDCHCKYLLEIFLNELKSGRVDDILKKHGLQLHEI